VPTKKTPQLMRGPLDGGTFSPTGLKVAYFLTCSRQIPTRPSADPTERCLVLDLDNATLHSTSASSSVGRMVRAITRPARRQDRRHRGCLMDIQRHILRRPLHESRSSLLRSIGLGGFHGSSSLGLVIDSAHATRGPLSGDPDTDDDGPTFRGDIGARAGVSDSAV
jgi:hypothetical protein